MRQALGICAVTAITLAFCALASAQAGGTEPKPKPGDYPVQARVGNVDLSAAYLVHTLPAESTNFLVPYYLVVEIAVYPPKSQAVAVAAGQFRLRINKKTELLPDTPETVAMSLKYPDYERHRGLQPQVGLGPVILGGPQQPVGRFPGDNRPDIGRGPTPPRTQDDKPVDTDRPPPQTAPEAAVTLAFPDGPCRRPVSGYLYFKYEGKAKSIKSLELIWQPGQEPVAVKIF
jgi:hypothetical protein